VIVKQNSQTEQQAGVAYAKLLLTDEGQKLLTQAGFISIPDADGALSID